MTRVSCFAALCMTLAAMSGSQHLFACSAYKITVGSSTMFGSNYDAWFTEPRIWFETDGYGAVFTGANRFNGTQFAPQSGMNEFGLAFTVLGAPKVEQIQVKPGKKRIDNRTRFLKDVLHSCRTVEEAQAYIDAYDHSELNGEVFLYADRSGKYLVVEPYLTFIGNDSRYVQANFCPSEVSDLSTIKQERYVKGVAFLKDKVDTTLAFCTALSDTMHVCREKIGDGTLLTTIWDLNEGIVHLYFYHDFTHHIQYNLTDELAKGDHVWEIASLFPANAEFQQLVDFKTPLNNVILARLVLFLLGFFLVSALVFLVSYFRKRRETKFAYIKLLLVPLSLIMMYYMVVLGTKINIYYFPAPYKDYTFSALNVLAYVPFLMILVIIPLLFFNIKVISTSIWGWVPKWTLTLNSLSYIGLIGMFFYWGLYDVFH